MPSSNPIFTDILDKVYVGPHTNPMINDAYSFSTNVGDLYSPTVRQVCDHYAIRRNEYLGKFTRPVHSTIYSLIAAMCVSV